MLDGAHHVNDVFLDNVKVPVANRIGKEGEGWTCAKFLLANERLGIAEVPASKRGVRSLKDIARAEPLNGGTLADDPAFAGQIADLDLQVQALEMSELRALSAMALGGAPGPEVSTLKIRGSEIQQRIAELTMEAVGEYAAPTSPACCSRTATRRRSAPTTRRRPRRGISTCARPASTAAATKFRRTSCPRWCWGYKCPWKFWLLSP